MPDEDEREAARAQGVRQNSAPAAWLLTLEFARKLRDFLFWGDRADVSPPKTHSVCG